MKTQSLVCVCTFRNSVMAGRRKRRGIRGFCELMPSEGRCGGGGGNPGPPPKTGRKAPLFPNWAALNQRLRASVRRHRSALDGQPRRALARPRTCARRSDDTDARKEARRCFGRSDCGKKLGKGG